MSTPGPSVGEAVEQFLARRRAGSTVTPRSFATRYAALGPELLDALEVAETLERVRAERTGESDFALPPRIGAFRVVREIGRGGMGVVLEAIEEPLGRRVALKLLPPDSLASAKARARLQREAALASRLDHPGVCTVFGAGVADGQPWIAMRFVEGTTLGVRIAAARERGARSVDDPRAVAACIAHVARALAAAHARGVLHRDVKPSNVMVAPGGGPVLLDFGLAIEPDSDALRLTRTGETAGTPHYLAPELIAGEIARPDERCDVYALGVTLYECLALSRPYRAPTIDALYREVLSGAAPDVRRANPAVPRDLAVVVATALERDRARRYASAEQLALDLEAVVDGRPIAARPVGSLGRALRWARRDPRRALLAGALAIAALALATLGGILLASRRDVQAGRDAQRARAIDQAISEAFADFGDKRYADADERFARVLELAPADADAQAGRVLSLLAQHRDERALALLAHAPHTRAYDGLRALAAHEAPLAEDSDWLSRATSFELFLDGHRLLLEADRHPERERRDWARKALTRLAAAVARAPQARALYHQIWAAAASDAGDEEATRSSSAALIALWPSSARAHYQAGFGLSDFDPRAALPLFERAIELDPSFAPALQCLGVAHARLGEFAAACEAYERAIAIRPSVEAYNALACALHDMGCPEDALAPLYAAIALDPWAVRPWANLQSYEPDAERSARAAEHVLELDPGLTHYRWRYGLALEFLGDARRACEQFGITVAEDPGNARYWTSYAHSLVAVEDPARALDAIAIARSLGAGGGELDELEERARVDAGRDD